MYIVTPQNIANLLKRHKKVFSYSLLFSSSYERKEMREQKNMIHNSDFRVSRREGSFSQVYTSTAENAVPTTIKKIHWAKPGLLMFIFVLFTMQRQI